MNTRSADDGTLNIFGRIQIAGLLKSTPTFVDRVFDKGLLKGWRVSGSQDIRVTRSDLLDFVDYYFSTASAAIKSEMDQI